MVFTELWPLWFLLLLPVMGVGLRYTLVDRAPAKRYGSFALRCLAVVLIILALCRPTVPQDSDRLHAVFAVDVSASVDLDAIDSSLDLIDQAVSECRSGDSHTLLMVGNGLQRMVSTDDMRKTLETWRNGASDDHFRSHSKLSSALSTARLTLPDDAACRVVLFTDQRPTDSGLGQAIKQLEGEGVEVITRALDGMSQPEVAVSSLATSSGFAHEGELVRFTATVSSNRSGPVEVRLVHRGVVVGKQEVQVEADESARVVFDRPMITPGRTVWSAEVAPVMPAAVSSDDASVAADHFVVNNRVSTTVHVRSGRPRILVIHKKIREMRAFANAMERQDLVVEVRPIEGTPTLMTEMLAFDAVVLANVSATDLSPSQLAMFKRYVTDFGGGLAMFGSENSFGLGGYYRTPVDEVLPLSSRFEQEKEKPSMAMVLVIDKSGSMQGVPIALARQAAKAAVELLGPQDQIGVVGFDGQAFVAVPLQPASDREGVKTAIDRIGAGGGTFMYAGMDAGRQMLDSAAARIKHMIVLGDGQSQAADHAGLAQQLVDMGVTISTVALGPGADQALMSQIAELGRGRYYQTMDPANVPQIFTRETMQASRSAIKEDLFSTIQVGDHPLLAGYNNTELPFTLGYVMTRARPTAQVLLATDTGDPLLAVHPYGLGQTMAFSADLTPRWGGEWLAWSGFGKFWAQSLRGLVRRPNTDPIRVEVEADSDFLHVSLTERISEIDPSATPTHWAAESLNDTGRSTPIEVRQLGVGRYGARVPLGKSPSITLRLHDPAGNRLRIVQFDRPYSNEYLLSSLPDPAFSDLPIFTPETIREGLVPAQTTLSLLPYLMLLGIGCYIAGVLLRRV